MKQSHFTTPRTLAETTFTTGYETTPQKMHNHDRIVVIASLLALMFLAGMFAGGAL